MTHLMPTYREPTVRFVSGHGCRLVDDAGKVYLDFLSGLGVTSLGHADPVVGGAIAAQAARLLHVSNIFGNEFDEDVAAQLDCLIGDGTPLGGQVFFANSGAEANECAIKLARRHGGPGRYGVVSALGSFHGRTLATLHATGQPAKHEAFLPLPAGFSHVAYRRSRGATGDRSHRRRRRAPRADPRRVRRRAAAARLPRQRAGDLRRARAAADRRRDPDGARSHGAVVRLSARGDRAGHRDGRQGSRQRRPGRRLLGPSRGRQGLPARRPRVDVRGTTVRDGRRAGDARAAARNRRARGSPPRLGSRLAGSLAELDGVAGVRGAGFLLGAVLEDGLDSRAVFGEALAAGLVVNAPVPGVIRLMPPFVVTESDCDEAVALLGVAIGRAGASARKPTGERG